MTAKRRTELPLVLLLLGLLLAPLMGGQLALDSALPGSPALDALTGGPLAPLLSHALIATPIVLAFVLMLLRRVIQVPNATLATALALFFGLYAASIMMSAFRFVSFGAVAEWLAYAVAFFTTVGIAGRRWGPQAVLGTLFVGCSLLAMRGVMEYGEMKALDPTHRIFAGWVNPNATAAMLMVGFFCGLAVLALANERMIVLLSGLGLALIGLAIFLTASKGVALVLAIATPVFLLLTASRANRTPLVRTAAAVAVIVVLGAATTAANSTAKPGSAANVGAAARFSQAEGTQEQSAGFRSLLWKGASQLVQARPIGYGAGTYRFENARTGLHTMTVFAHQSFLQLAVEGSLALPLLLFSAGLLWLRLVFRGWRRLPPDRRVLQGAVVAGVLAVVMHSFVDSDLHYFGIGLSFFALLGLGTVASADGVAPEFAPRASRFFALGGALAILALLYYVGYAELLRAEVRQSRDLNAARATLDSLLAIAPNDGEAWYLAAMTATGGERRALALQQAVLNAPSPRNYRALARFRAEQADFAGAAVALRSALQRDPNNLPALAQLAEVERRSGDETGYREALERLVDVEETTYFQIRSLPELVPTETYEARVALAQDAPPDEKVGLLKPAVEGFRQYLAQTVPNVKRFAQSSPNQGFGGETEERAKAKMAIASRAASDLADAYRSIGNAAEAESAESAAGAFAGAFDK
jgi:tetratricopeptide (TPR) repeat protein